MLAQKSGKGIKALLYTRVQQSVNVVTAKLDDVTKILTDLKTDLDASKLPSQRMPAPLMHGDVLYSFID